MEVHSTKENTDLRSNLRPFHSPWHKLYSTFVVLSANCVFEESQAPSIHTCFVKYSHNDKKQTNKQTFVVLRMILLSPRMAEKANGSLLFIPLQVCVKTFSGHLLLLQSIAAKMKSSWKNRF